MQANEDNIPLLPVSVFLYDPRNDQWPGNKYIFFLDKNMETVFKGTINSGNKNMYNIHLKEGKYSIFLENSINRNLVSWDIYINVNGILKNICSSDNYNCDSVDDCYPDTFVLTLDDFNQSKVINTEVANIKEAVIDTLDVKTIKLGNNLLTSSDTEFSVIKNLNTDNISFGHLPYNLRLINHTNGPHSEMYRLHYAHEDLTDWINHTETQNKNTDRPNNIQNLKRNVLSSVKIKKTKNMALSFPVKKKN